MTTDIEVESRQFEEAQLLCHASNIRARCHALAGMPCDEVALELEDAVTTIRAKLGDNLDAKLGSLKGGYSGALL
jgi:hypothetical protein